jgi:hypothetical protein
LNQRVTVWRSRTALIGQTLRQQVIPVQTGSAGIVAFTATNALLLTFGTL